MSPICAKALWALDFQIVGLARRQEEVHRIAQRIDKRMNLGAQPAFAAPDRLVFAVFFCAPALC